MMQVDNIVEVFGIQVPSHLPEIFFKNMNLIDIRIGLEDGPEGGFCKIMYFRRRHLFFQTPDKGCRKYNISDRAESYNKKLHSSPFMARYNSGPSQKSLPASPK